MFQEENKDFQYNSCVSRGICSINPRILALQTVILLFLRIFAKQTKDKNLDSQTENFILTTIVLTINNPEYNENSYLFAIKALKKILPKYLDNFSTANIKEEKEKVLKLLDESFDIIKAIKFGEKILAQSQKALSSEIRDLFNIILIITKSLSVSLLELQDYKKENSSTFKEILTLLSKINIEEIDVEYLKTVIHNSAKLDISLMSKLREAQEERYGIQNINEVSYTTIPNKAVLVVGSNIKELENVLEALKEENIDVYTHDDMMLAHTFPKFLKYPKLRGQFGFGLENCLLDFATFPGPIILTKNSLHNIENFYRGRLFTTDYTTLPKGIIKIVDNNFSEVIESAYQAKGFKTGKQCETVLIGYNYKKITQYIKKKLENKNYKQIFLIGFDSYSFEQRAYFEKLIKLAPNDFLFISFSYSAEKDNVIFINTCFDYFAIIKIFNFLHKLKLPTTVFIPKCDKKSISQIVYFSSFDNTNVYVGKCISTLFNPNLIKTLLKEFKINSLSFAKKDLDEIIKKIV